jgi:hypothetical protein
MGFLTTVGLVVQSAEPVVAVGHKRAQAECLGQSQGVLVLGFSLHNIGVVGVGLSGAQLVQRIRFVGTLLVLPGQGERLGRALPGLLAASRQTINLTEPCHASGMILKRAHAKTCADRLLRQRTPLREVPLERIGKAQGCCGRSQIGRVTRGATQGQALIEPSDGGH